MTLAAQDRLSSRYGNGTVLIVDDHPLLTQGLSFALRAEGLDTVISVNADLDNVIALARDHRPVLALLDLQFGSRETVGMTLIGPLKQLGTPSLVVTGVADAAVLGACLEAGAVGVARKSESFDEVLERIEAALCGGTVNTVREREELLAALRRRRADDEGRLGPIRALTEREQQVLDQLMRGLAADVIAEQMFLSLATVRTHIQAIFRKLDVNTQLAAVAHARAAGWSLTAPRTSDLYQS